jgi:hypothetical protein
VFLRHRQKALRVARRVLGLLALTACSSQSAAPPAPQVTALVATRFARLSHTQWELTVKDLFYFDTPTGLSASFSPDPLGGKVFDNNQSALEVSSSLFGDYQTAAEAIAEAVTSHPEQLARILPAILSTDPTTRVSDFLASFGFRAFRRPLLPEELNQRRVLFERGASIYPSVDPFVAGVRLSIAAFLQSPHFLYRMDLSPEASQGSVTPLNEWELASRLSYAIWNSMPDDELFRAASANELATVQGVHAQVERMLDNPRASAAVKRFFDQLYDGDQYLSLSKSPTLYPDFVPEVGIEMRAELAKFTANVFEQGQGVRDLLTSPTTFVTPRLASRYGIAPETLPTPDADGFSRVELDGTQRSGLLTRLGFLAWKGKESEPNTIQRGVFITRRVICQRLGNPPVAALHATLGNQPTDRQRVEALTGVGTCGEGCHARYINPAGFAFEHFGAMGEHRLLEGNLPIDAASSFPFQEGAAQFSGAIEFSQKLAASAQVHACFVGFLLEYLLGREHSEGDSALAMQLAALSLADTSVRELFTKALESDALRYPLVVEEAL